MQTLICPECGDLFEVEKSEAEERKYCSRSCVFDASRTRVELACARCGDTFEVARSLAERGQRYCSKACYRADRFGPIWEHLASQDEGAGRAD